MVLYLNVQIKYLVYREKFTGTFSPTDFGMEFADFMEPPSDRRTHTVRSA